ncbi:MAG: uroporphyrinogen decarboxylase family protein [Treponema sp.]|jgi:uroporphyrinogen decarboxylase|nr:uroporphyrinogen decarboxylase family protein [Treponema sp.]
MNSKERLYARLAGKPVDKIPNLNIYMHIVAREAGVSYREFVQNYRKLAEGNLICAEKYGADHVGVISDPMREASAYGTEVVFPENGVPYAKQPLITGDFDLSVLQRFDPLESTQTLDRIKGCELLRQKVGQDYPVIGWIEGCIAEAADLRGLSELLEDLAMEETYLAEMFEVLHEQQKRFAKAQIDAGADIIGVGNAAASLIGPGLYKKYGMSWDKAIVDYIHSCGAKVKLHICGNITPLLELLREVGPDILDIDWMVDFARAVKEFDGSKTAVSGNVNPVAVLMQGTSECVESQIKYCLEVGSATTCIAAGCEVPVAAPDENLFLMDRLLYTDPSRLYSA